MWRSKEVSGVIFTLILVVGAFNVAFMVLSPKYTYNSFLLTLLVLAALITFHCYYVISREVVSGNLYSTLHALAMVLTLVVFDEVLQVPKIVMIGDSAILLMVLLSIPFVLYEGGKSTTQQRNKRVDLGNMMQIVAKKSKNYFRRI